MNPTLQPSHSTPTLSRGGGLLSAPWLAALAASTVLVATASTLALAFDARRLFRVDGQAGFGRTVSDAGDFNGDGYADVIVGMPTYTSELGRVFLYYGGPNADAVPDLTVTGMDFGYRFGASVSAAGDVNGDGYATHRGSELPRHRDRRGASLRVHGGPRPMPSRTDAERPAATDLFGIRLGAGDVNGDSCDDLIVGAR
jgi:hypothetical protein